MSTLLAERVQETAAAPGTGAVTLGGAVTGYQTFAAGVGSGNTTPYVIQDSAGNWEYGLGTVGGSGPYTLTRTTFKSGSAANPVNFASLITVFSINCWHRNKTIRDGGNKESKHPHGMDNNNYTTR